MPTALGPAAGVATQPITISHTVQNQGTGDLPASHFRVYVYLSSDAVFSAEDMLFVQDGFTVALAAGASTTRNVGATLPNVPAGDYYLISVVDAEVEVPEANETNNTFVSPITITN